MGATDVVLEVASEVASGATSVMVRAERDREAMMTERDCEVVLEMASEVMRAEWDRTKEEQVWRIAGGEC